MLQINEVFHRMEMYVINDNLMNFRENESALISLDSEENLIYNLWECKFIGLVQ